MNPGSVQAAAPHDLEALARAIVDAHEDCLRHSSLALQHAMVAGHLLQQAKAQVAHGHWLDWIAEHCGISARTAQTYMRVAREYPSLSLDDAQRAAHLSLRQAVAALSAPSRTVDEWEPDRRALAAHDARLSELRVLISSAKRRLAEDLTLSELIELHRQCDRWQADAAEINLRCQRRAGELLSVNRAGGYP
jgi:hypothetical protein